jgi:hypothetical protein
VIYFLPDSQDLVDPSFDFDREDRAASRMRHRDDVYAHQVFRQRAYDGVLVSKGIVEGFGHNSARYTLSQRMRFLRLGAKAFCRTESCKWGSLPIMGDCGGFTYVQEEVPPFSVDEVVAFYLEGQFDLGISVDHVILDFQPSWDDIDSPGRREAERRQGITLDLAKSFLELATKEKVPFEPMGVAQGWSPKSYAASVKALQSMGYTYIALGGMVPLKTNEILASLHEIDRIRKPTTRMHLLGVTRIEEVLTFERLGVVSFDSTSPLLKAFKDDKDNYFTPEGALPAIRIPQVDGNAKLKAAILSGQVSQDRALKLERASLAGLKAFDEDRCTVDEALEPILAYHELCGGKAKQVVAYRRVLETRPWRDCPCEICTQLGYHVVVFRGAERNRRRGFHNIWTFYQRLHRNLNRPVTPLPLFTET